MTPHDSPANASPQPISRLLIANRGEIASRILSTAREHHPRITTYALSSPGDTSHTLHASHVLSLSSPSEYLSIPKLLSLARDHSITHIHPGYGFLSESADFATQAADAGMRVIGPGAEILARTGDKLAAKRLAISCGVPVLHATETPISDIQSIRSFVSAPSVGYPIMLKAVDGGGGRGIRLVREEAELEAAVKRAIAESPSRQVFVEKAAVEGFRHVEVQILGDGKGGVRHLWERECSIQRRYQKIVEVAPAGIADRGFVSQIIEAAVNMARELQYKSLGTFEFLANPDTGEWFFLEVNPRLQVEHTVTEELCGIDIVEAQLRIEEGGSVDGILPQDLGRDPAHPSQRYAIQLRVCAENADANFSLSIGRIGSFHFPSGNGIRVDTALVAGHENAVSADFDSLIAKIIVSASSWDAVVRKARRAIQDTYVNGAKTNISVLRGVLESQEFDEGRCDTAWFENNMERLIEEGKRIENDTVDEKFFQHRGVESEAGATTGLSSSAVLFRKGDAWTIKLEPESQENDAELHHLKLEKVLRNEFPSLLNARIAYATPSQPEPQMFNVTLNATSATSGSAMAEGKHRKGDPGKDSHVSIPFPGKMVELLVDEGDVLQAGDVVCIVQQMKMELEVRCKKAGKVIWVTEIEDGEDVAEGDLAVEIDIMDEARPKL